MASNYPLIYDMLVEEAKATFGNNWQIMRRLDDKDSISTFLCTPEDGLLPNPNYQSSLGHMMMPFKDVYAKTFHGALDGNATSADVADSADRLTTARNIALQGAVRGNTTFNGAENVVINTSLDERYGMIAVQEEEPTDNAVKMWVQISTKSNEEDGPVADLDKGETYG